MKIVNVQASTDGVVALVRACRKCGMRDSEMGSKLPDVCPTCGHTLQYYPRCLSSRVVADIVNEYLARTGGVA